MIEQTNLTKFKLIASEYISACLADTFAEKPETSMELLGGMMAESIMWRVKQPIWGEGYIGPTIEYPANWKEAVKERFAPAWFKSRWPVEKTTKHFKAKILYPLISFPREKHWFSVGVADGER